MGQYIVLDLNPNTSISILGVGVCVHAGKQLVREIHYYILHLVVRLENSRCRHLLPNRMEVAVVRGSLSWLGHLSTHPIGGRGQ